MALRDRIVKLLRIARDQQGTPEGETAATIAQHLIEKNPGITVDTQNLPEPPPVPMIRAVVATYDQIESWRQHLVQLVQLLWGLAGSWGSDGEVVTLYFTIEEDREATLVRAVNYYLDLQDAITQACAAAPVLMGSVHQLAFVNAHDPQVQELFRRGVTDAWCAAIDRMLKRYKEKMAEQMIDADLAVIGTALVRVPVVLADDEGSKAAMVPHEAEQADQLGLMIYQLGVIHGSRTYDWPVPDLDEPADDAEDDVVDDGPTDEAHSM